MTKKNKRIILIVILVVATAVVVFYKLKIKANQHESLEEISPFYGKIETSISATGVVQPQNRVEIKPSINGRIEKIFVKEGDKVREGQIIAWMSSTERAALLDAARAQGKESIEYWQGVYKPTPIISPINGKIIVCTKKPGQTITTNDGVVVISDRLIVQAQVDETDIGRVKEGQNAIINLDAYPEIKLKGKVTHIYHESTTVNNVTIYQVDIIHEFIPPVFRSGMSATVSIIERVKDNILLLPLEAVKIGKRGSFVLMKGKTSARPIHTRIKTGISDDKNIEIKSGLTDKDRILIVKQKYNPEDNQNAQKRSFFMPVRPTRHR